jgi:hypothetical protein
VQFLLLGFIGDSYITALEELREQLALVKVTSHLLFPSAYSDFIVKKVNNMLLEGLFLLFPLLLEVINVFELIHVHCVH